MTITPTLIATTGAEHAAGTFTVPAPANAAGDLLLLLVADTGSGAAALNDTGWSAVSTLVLNTKPHTAYVRVSSGSEPATYSFTAGGSGCAVTIMSWRYAKAVSVYSNALTSLDSGGGTSRNVVGTSVVVPTAGSALVGWFVDFWGYSSVQGPTTLTTPAGATLARTSAQIGGEQGITVYETNLAAGATGTRTSVLTTAAAIVDIDYGAMLLVVEAFAVPGAPGAVTDPAAASTVNTTATIGWGAASDADTATGALTYQIDLSTDNGATWANVVAATAAGVTSLTFDFSGKPATTAAKVRVRTFDGLNYSAWTTSSAFTIQHNQTPTAPTLLGPVGGVSIDKDTDQVFSTQFNDPDAGDHPSAHMFDYRIVGAGAWTSTGWVTSTAQSWTVVASTLAAGDYEWRAFFKDALGLASPASASGFFTAASVPGAPAITHPASGGTIATNVDTIDWTIASQDAYQVRKVADAAGAPNTGTVYYDTGTIVSATDRNAPLSFPTNSRYEHLQVRVRLAGLWSAWSSNRVLVSFTPPAEPTAVLVENTPDGAISVSATRPAPSGSQPTVVSFDVYRRDVGDTGDGIRIAAAIAPTGSFEDFAIASNVGGASYEYRVLDNGNNGAVTFSLWVGGSTVGAGSGSSIYGGTP